MRVAQKVLILLTVMFMITAVSGCTDIDWKESAKKVAIEWVKGQVIVAIDKYGDKKSEAVAWVVDSIEGADALDSVTKWIPLEALAESAWDYVWAEIYEKARENGMDVDAEDGEQFAWYVTGADFPGVDGELMALLE